MNQSRSLQIQYLQPRATLLRELRAFFDQRGFIEVQTPCLSRDCVVDAYIDPVTVDSRQFGLAEAGLPESFYLQSSPEAAMKRLLAGGAPSIYSIGPVFRAGERGDQHNLEFTMLEWYDVGATMDGGVRLLGELATQILGHDAYDVQTYRQLFRDRWQLDPIESPIGRCRQRVRSVDPALAESIGDDRDSLLDVLLTAMQAELGRDRPLIVTHYPLSQAALARTAADDPACAARFELFAAGMELANGYDELRDVETLIARYECNNRRRIRAGRRPLPVETTLTDAMRRGLPACAGVAMGVDRLLMVRHGAQSIEEVLPMTIEHA
jgi:lysyl-tRNA synthetase class 2